MRACADRLLAPHAESPSPEKLETLTLQLRGHIMLTLPEVEAVTTALPAADVARACALFCAAEARLPAECGARPQPVRPDRARATPRSVPPRAVRPLREQGPQVPEGARASRVPAHA
ncbi:DUF6415 family natural product biosynthesis protein [Streptomyces africanus]|uniref:DUF6415 family natural product biosynthesis protein n=1 Tax=Streptomyces africanus TaxID=231024 RepID=UPI001FC9B993|nr:DUF6415 family natural product biosynthesis protein [Streptomyces africanus]